MSKLAISDLAIILVEPSATQLKLILKHLKEEGIRAIEGVSSGAEAWRLVQNYRPDLVISSMYLPDMTATELFGKIAAAGTFERPEFMLISSETDRAALEPIRQSGVVAILPKPFDHNDLKRALGAAVDFVEPEQWDLEHYDIETIRVLIVDDSATSRRQIAKVLANMGIVSVTLANGGREGLEIFRQAQDAFDLIVTDYNMPEINGRELVHIIRGELNNHFIPILMVTSEQNQTRLDGMHQAGVSDIINKPFEPEHIRRLLTRLID